MGCKFGKENTNEVNDYSAPQKQTPIIQKDDNLHNYGSVAETTNRVAKYETRIDRRVTSKYDIKALIGKGTFSEVLRVESKISRQPFAIKVLKIQSDIEKQLSTSELSALAKISHHFVVKLEEVIISKGVIYLVMQLATGGELFDRIKSKGHFDEKYSCNVTQMLVEAISYLHLSGIIHRDLKPENILFYHPGKDSKILITDFGFAKVKTGGVHADYATTWCGTPEYIGPELVKRLPYNNKVDLWALGVIVYIMLSGHLPFSAPSSPKLFNLIMNGIYSYRKPVWSGVSDNAKDFINKLLVVDPKLRFDAGDASCHPWVSSCSPLHKRRDNFILGKFNASKQEKIVIDTPSAVNNMTNNKNNNFNKVSQTANNVNAFKNCNFSNDPLATDELISQELIEDNGLILPVSGEFQGDIISKEKVLEENMSTLTLDNTTSTTSNIQTIHKHEVGLDDREDELFAQTVKVDIVTRKSPPHLADALSLSNKLLAFPLQLSEKVSAYDEFEVLHEDSQHEPSYDFILKRSRSSLVTSETIIGSHYIENVGVCLSDAIKETSFSDKSNSAESFVTLEKTISTATNYQSAHSSFRKFSLPPIMKTQEDINIPLKVFCKDTHFHDCNHT